MCGALASVHGMTVAASSASPEAPGQARPDHGLWPAHRRLEARRGDLAKADRGAPSMKTTQHIVDNKSHGTHTHTHSRAFRARESAKR